MKSQEKINNDCIIKHINNIKLYNNSRGLSFIYDTLGKKNDFLGIILFSLFWIIIFSIATLIEGTFSMTGSNTIGWSIDFVWYGVIIAITLLFFFSKKLFDKFIKLFSKDILNSLRKEIISEKKYYEIINKNIKFIRNETPKSKNLLYLLIIFGFFGFIIYGLYFQIIEIPSVDVWHHAIHPLGYFVWLIYTFIILVYLGPILIWRYIAIMISINNIVKEIKDIEGFNIIPISPDNVGGLSNLGKFALNVAYIPTIPLIVVAIWVFVREITSPLFLVTVPILIAFIIIAFTIPLYSIHRLLESAKEKELHRISNEFDKYYQIVVKNIDKAGPTFNDVTNEAVNNMEKLKIMFESCERMGLWPINIQILIQLSSIILIPTLVAIVPSFI
jgi:MFS family permease